MSGVSRRITIVEYTLHAILWHPWKAKFMRLPTGDNYLFSSLSFPSSPLIRALITHSTRIKFKPEKEKCTYTEVTPGKQWVELGCSWCQLCQVAVGNKLIGHHYNRFHHPHFMPFLYRIEWIVLVGLWRQKQMWSVLNKCLQRKTTCKWWPKLQNPTKNYWEKGPCITQFVLPGLGRLGLWQFSRLIHFFQCTSRLRYKG